MELDREDDAGNWLKPQRGLRCIAGVMCPESIPMLSLIAIVQPVPPWTKQLRQPLRPRAARVA